MDIVDMNDVCYIIGHRDTSADQLRTKNLLFVISMIKEHFPMFEILVVEQSKSPSLEIAGRNDIHYLHVKNLKFFNRSWTFNLGQKNTNRNILICADNDIWMQPEELRNSLNYLSCHDAVSPYTSIINLTQKETELVFINNKFEDYPHAIPRSRTSFSSGIVMYTRNGYEKTFGWDEEFRGWGAEDNAQTYKTELLVKSTEVNHKAYHFYHQKDIKNGDVAYHENYENNLKLMKLITSMDANELNKYYKKKYANYGNPRKYANEYFVEKTWNLLTLPIKYYRRLRHSD